jgi:hypothetical protein
MHKNIFLLLQTKTNAGYGDKGTASLANDTVVHPPPGAITNDLPLQRLSQLAMQS